MADIKNYLIWGKHPDAPDYISIGDAGGKLAGFKNWLQAGCEADLRCRLGCSDGVMTYCSIGWGKDQPSHGLLTSSCDARGRKFPLLLSFTEKKGWGFKNHDYLHMGINGFQKILKGYIGCESIGDVERLMQGFRAEKVVGMPSIESMSESDVAKVAEAVKRTGVFGYVRLDGGYTPEGLFLAVRAAELLMECRTVALFHRGDVSIAYYRPPETGDYLELFDGNKRDWEEANR